MAFFCMEHKPRVLCHAEFLGLYKGFPVVEVDYVEPVPGKWLQTLMHGEVDTIETILMKARVDDISCPPDLLEYLEDLHMDLQLFSVFCKRYGIITHSDDAAPGNLGVTEHGELRCFDPFYLQADHDDLLRIIGKCKEVNQKLTIKGKVSTKQVWLDFHEDPKFTSFIHRSKIDPERRVYAMKYELNEAQIMLMIRDKHATIGGKTRVLTRFGTRNNKIFVSDNNRSEPLFHIRRGQIVYYELQTGEVWSAFEEEFYNLYEKEYNHQKA